MNRGGNPLHPSAFILTPNPSPPPSPGVPGEGGSFPACGAGLPQIGRDHRIEAMTLIGRTTPLLRQTLVFLLPLVLLAAAPGCQVDENKEVALYRSVIDAPNPVHIEYHPGEPLSLP